MFVLLTMLQRLLADQLISHGHVLTLVSRAGGVADLSADAARRSAESAINESEDIAKQVRNS